MFGPLQRLAARPKFNGLIAPGRGPEIRSEKLGRVMKRWGLIGLLAWVPCSATLAQSVSETPDAAPGLIGEIVAAARESANQLDASSIGDVDTSAEAFSNAVDQFQEYLSSSTTSDNAQAWIDYLELPAAIEAVEAGDNDSDIARKLIRLAQKATGMHPGLETPSLARLRDAANDYSNALRFRRKDAVAGALSRQLEKFAEQWDELDGDPTPDDLATLNLLLDLLNRTGQNVSLVERSRLGFSASNVHLMVDESVVTTAVRRQVNQCTPVRDCILGTRIIGDALLTGEVSAKLLPAEGSVRLELTLNGTVHSSNVGYNGPVRLRTSGTGDVQASRILEVGEDGVRFEPVRSSASLNTRINAIEHRMRLVRKIARKKAAEQKPLADRIARAKLVSRVAEGFAEETESAAAAPEGDAMERARTILKRLGLDEPLRRFGSTQNSVFLFATVRQANQLAASDPPPPVRDASHVTVQIHESLINNTLGTILSGRTMTQAELQQLASKSGRTGTDTQTSDSDDSETQADEESFEIDFDSNRPIIFEPRENQLRVGIRGTRFAQGSRELKRPLEIVAVYQPLTTESGDVVLDRVGEVEINFPGRKRLSVSEAGLRGSIKKGFADAFPQQLLDRDLAIPEDFAVPSLRGVSVHPRYFDAQKGWLSLGLDAKGLDLQES